MHRRWLAELDNQPRQINGTRREARGRGRLGFRKLDKGHTPGTLHARASLPAALVRRGNTFNLR